ncbi:glycosyltransferase family 2 protein [Candidatus Methylocalor cossyra]|uniref:CPS-53 (KpLE1) prophage bactoprenol glucosyl transferase n=1 Tax=Candidatus Methylocalor cossyra TaxID=3108543 RepID=A0ABM9NMG9_9GAMM
MTTVSLVVPVFNEAKAIPRFFSAVEPVLRELDRYQFEFVFVNDGSTDDTLPCLVEISKHNPRLMVVDLSRNFGKEAAITAGLQEATGDAVIPMDVDLQDPPELIPRMLDEWRRGYEVVLARRVDRSSDSFLKRVTASWFYRVHNWVSHPKIPEDVGDFRLLDRKVVDALNSLPERRRFMKGLFAWLGFRTRTIDYTRRPRSAGESKFSGWKLWNLALEGITSFSTMPLQVWSYLGLVVALLAFAYLAFIVGRTLLFGSDVPGYASLIAAVLGLGGLQLLGIGVLGEYIGRIYMESKQRPVYLVRARFRRGVELEGGRGSLYVLRGGRGRTGEAAR